jgi:hypothetical protein
VGSLETGRIESALSARKSAFLVNSPVGGKNTLDAEGPLESRRIRCLGTIPNRGQRHRQNLDSHEMYKDMNLYNVYFVSKDTGPETVQIEAQNSAGAKAQVEARYPGAYNIMLNQLPRTAKRKSD